MAQRTHGPRAARVLWAAAGAVVLVAVVMAVAGVTASVPRLTGADSAKDNLRTPAPTGAGAGSASTTTTTTEESSTACNVLEQLVNACATVTTTTVPPTALPPAPRATTPVPSTDPRADTGACSGTTPPVAPPAGAWTCTLDDEFDGSAPNPAIWQPVLTSTSGFQSGSLFAQVCYVDNPGTISESGGTLDLSVVQLPAPTNCQQPGGSSFVTSYEGGMLASYQLFSQQYGFFEVRAAVPATSVPGLQETLWLYPEDETLYGPWPDSGEIDYGEFYSSYPLADVPDVHYPGSALDPNATTPLGCSIAGDATAGRFNTYALSWTPTTITTYFNGIPCTTDTYAPYVASPDAAPEPFNQPFFLAFTAALGMNGTDTFQPGATPLPATTLIDWVRVWQY